MAVLANPLSSTAQITYHMGFNEDGKVKQLTRSLTGFKTGVSDQIIYDVADIITSLQEHNVTAICRVNKVELEEE